jgi:hypothetical protein
MICALASGTFTLKASGWTSLMIGQFTYQLRYLQRRPFLDLGLSSTNSYDYTKKEEAEIEDLNLTFSAESKYDDFAAFHQPTPTRN